MNTKDLPALLSAVDLSHETLMAPSGIQFTVLVRGARILSAWHPDLDEDLFWVNPALADEPSLRAFLRSEHGWNTGGDRTWLAPEVSLHMSDPQRWNETYRVPAGIDPGHYAKADAGPGWVTLAQQAQVHDFRHNADLVLRLSKTVRLAPDPLAADGGLPEGVIYGGYELVTAIESVGASPPETAVGLWMLLQIPAGGQVLIPTIGRGRVRDYFAPTGASHLRLGMRHVAFTIDGRSRHKIALKAAWHWGRMGYRRPIGRGRATLIVRNFVNNPSGRYVDVPAADLADEGYSLQCYNDGGEFGGFGEMEYHAPAIGAGGARAYIDTSQLWCFIGPTAAIRAVADRLLGLTGGGRSR